MIKNFLAHLWVTMLLISTAQAAEWSLTATLNPSVKYDDNVFMAEDETDSFHYAISPTAVIGRVQDTSDTSLSLGYVIDRYSSLSFLDKENPFIRFDSSYRTERSSWGLEASYVESSSRTDAADDTGDFRTESSVKTETISPSYSYQITERDSLSIGGSYSQKTFSTTDFSDSKSRSLNTGWQHQFSERLSAGLNLSASNFQSDGLTTSTDDDNYNLSTSLNYDLSELWNIGGNIGVRRLNSEQKDNLGNIEKNSSSGASFNLDASRRTDRDTLTIGVSRSVAPSSTGDVNETDRLNLSWSRTLSETITASMSASYQQTTSASEETDQKRENINFSPAIRWQLEPNLGLNFAYNYRQQKESDIDSDVDSNAVSITLNYDWDGLRASR